MKHQPTTQAEATTAQAPSRRVSPQISSDLENFNPPEQGAASGYRPDGSFIPDKEKHEAHRFRNGNWTTGHDMAFPGPSLPSQSYVMPPDQGSMVPTPNPAIYGNQAGIPIPYTSSSEEGRSSCCTGSSSQQNSQTASKNQSPVTAQPNPLPTPENMGGSPSVFGNNLAYFTNSADYQAQPASLHTSNVINSQNPSTYPASQIPFGSSMDFDNQTFSDQFLFGHTTSFEPGTINQQSFVQDRSNQFAMAMPQYQMTEPNEPAAPLPNISNGANEVDAGNRYPDYMNQQLMPMMSSLSFAGALPQDATAGVIGEAARSAERDMRADWHPMPMNLSSSLTEHLPQHAMSGVVEEDMQIDETLPQHANSPVVEGAAHSTQVNVGTDNVAPFPGTNVSSSDQAEALDTCQCGSGCECLQCERHPQNARTRTWAKEMMNIIDDDQDLYGSATSTSSSWQPKDFGGNVDRQDMAQQSFGLQERGCAIALNLNHQTHNEPTDDLPGGEMADNGAGWAFRGLSNNDMEALGYRTEEYTFCTGCKDPFGACRCGETCDCASCPIHPHNNNGST